MAVISSSPLNCVPLFLLEGLFMKKSLLLGAVALASLGLAGCGEKAVDDAANGACVVLNGLVHKTGSKLEDNDVLQYTLKLVARQADTVELMQRVT